MPWHGYSRNSITTPGHVALLDYQTVLFLAYAIYGSLCCVCIFMTAGASIWWLIAWTLMTWYTMCKWNGEHGHAHFIFKPHPLTWYYFVAYVCRVRLCVSVTEAEVERAKNIFRTNLFMNLDGGWCALIGVDRVWCTLIICCVCVCVGSTAICEDIGRWDCVVTCSKLRLFHFLSFPRLNVWVFVVVVFCCCFALLCLVFVLRLP